MMSPSAVSHAPDEGTAATPATYRVYVRLPNQKVAEKTTTVNEAVARFAWDRIVERRGEFRDMGAIGLVMSKDGAQVDYLKF